MSEKSGSAPAFLPIEDYAVIGNCRTAALVGTNGSIDWLCLPRFDSPSVFGRLLDHAQGGHFRIGPSLPRHEGYTVRRRYVGDTVLLETTFITETGRLRLIDLMPVTHEQRKRNRPWPQHQILRCLECVEGEVEVEARFDPRLSYGRLTPTIEEHGKLGLWCQGDAHMLALLSDFALATPSGEPGAHGTETLRQGEHRHFSLIYAGNEPAVLLPLDTCERLVRDSAEWWEEWSSQLEYEGPYREQLIRSALTLKLLTYAPSGAIVAAVTTSLPETIGGERNWDYRFCWLRDASWTLRALHDAGFRDEGRAFFDWVLYVTKLTAPRIRPLYDVLGGTRLIERSLGHLGGYRDSRPVRIGNKASGQLQLDVYGEVVATAHNALHRGDRWDEAELDFLVGLGRAVCDLWEQPDHGLWEIRHESRHHTHSIVMCWSALDRIIRLHESGTVRAPVERFREVRDQIRARIERDAFDPRTGAYFGTLEDKLLDSALLLLAEAGYIGAMDERYKATAEMILERLDAGDGLLYRYAHDFDDLPGAEGTFILCAFWAVEALALVGDLEAARARFDRLLEHANDVGLYAEEIHPRTHAFLGNFPQAFTHIGLINAALTLRAAEASEAEARARAATDRQTVRNP